MNIFSLRFILALSLFYFLFSLPLIQSQSSQKISFTAVNNTNGLPNNNVNDIVKDNLGFVWIATSDGLSRYESSNHVKTYKGSDPLIPTGLQSSNIRSLCVDSKDNLWIGTVLGGLTRYHQASDIWTTYRHDSSNPNSISNDEILSITEDRKGRIWVGTEYGLNVFDPETNSFTSFLPSEKANSLRAKAVLTIMEDHNGFLWAGTWEGGFYLVIPSDDGDLKNTRFRQFEPLPGTQANSVWKIYQDKDNRYWLGTHGGGLFNMQLPDNIDNNVNHQGWNPSFHQVIYEKSDETMFSNGIITDILHDKDGRIWISTLNGLSLIQASEFNFDHNLKNHEPLHVSCTRYVYSPDNPSSIAHNNVNNIYEDDQGIIWLSTSSGISKYNWYTNQFDIHDLFQHVSNSSEKQHYYIDKKGMIWIATIDKGLMLYDVNTQNTKAFEYNHLLADLNITALHSADGVHLCVGSQSKGVSVLNMETKAIINFPIPEWIRIKHPDFHITTLFHGSQNRIWLGTPNGLFLINKTSGEYTVYKHDRDNPQSICDNSVTHIMEDHIGNTWIATYNGLSRIDHKTTLNKMRFQSFKHDPTDPEHSIPSNRLTTMVEIEAKLYIGSVNGLFCYDPETERFTDLSKGKNKYGFKSLEKTRGGDIWGSTTGGIVFYDMDKATFNRFEKADGLGDITFQNGSSGQDTDGFFYFGSRRGITRFNPDKLTKNRALPPVHITEIKTMSPKGVKQISGLFQEELILNHDDYYLSIEFAGLNYNRSEKNRYAYQLIGFDKEWVYDDHNPSAVYTNLEAGEYQFHVKASNNDGLWNAVGKTLYITVKPAFWETSWFIGGCIICLGFFIFGWFHLYTKKVRKRNNKLQLYNENLNNEITERKKVEAALQERDQHMEQLVKKRTVQLEAKNDEVKELLNKITTRNEELESIVAQRTKSLQSSNAELLRSNNDLEQFAYIASHDLQEPLRTIGSFIGLLGKSYEDQLPEEAKQYIAFANDGVHRMSKLIKSLLTYSKVGREGIEFSNTNLSFLLSQKLIDLSKKIEERNVVIEMDCLPDIHCEPNQLGMVFYNLVNNAIKFNNSTTPTVKIKRHDQAPEGFWKFSVQDNGIGIDEKYQKKIFEIFSRLHGREYEGTGIGLALCQKIVLAHGGEIWLESQKGEGTTFFITVSKQMQMQGEPQERSLLKEMYN